MAKKKPLARKRRTREHVIADLSANHFERYVLLAGHTVERPAYDYGIDLTINTYNLEGEVEAGEIRVQLKATDHLKLTSDATSVRFRIDRRDLLNWLDQPMPIILVVYDARNEVGYWLYVQAYFGQQRGFNRLRASATVTVRIPTSHRIDENAVRTFVVFRDRLASQLEGKLNYHE